MAPQTEPFWIPVARIVASAGMPFRAFGAPLCRPVSAPGQTAANEPRMPWSER